MKYIDNYLKELYDNNDTKTLVDIIKNKNDKFKLSLNQLFWLRDYSIEKFDNKTVEITFAIDKYLHSLEREKLNKQWKDRNSKYQEIVKEHYQDCDKVETYHRISINNEITKINAYCNDDGLKRVYLDYFNEVEDCNLSFGVFENSYLVNTLEDNELKLEYVKIITIDGYDKYEYKKILNLNDLALNGNLWYEDGYNSPIKYSKIIVVGEARGEIFELGVFENV